jgi:hypothetical protein
MRAAHRLTLLMTILMLGGCGEFAYKTGAGADALAADKAACQQAGGDYRACMHDKGWTIADLGGDVVRPPVAPPPPMTATPTAAAPDGSAPMAAAPSAPGAVLSSAPAAPAAAPADPMAPVRMTAWVRFGGGGPQDDIAACVASLGPAHAPDTVNHTVTRALLACMKEKGWRGL